MGRGLSDIQKKILKVVSELPPGMVFYPNHMGLGAYEKLKVALYPDLYHIVEYHGVVKECRFQLKVKHAGHSDELNKVRVTLSRSIKRLVERQYLRLQGESRNGFSSYNPCCIYITQSGRDVLTVNGVDKHDSTNQ